LVGAMPGIRPGAHPPPSDELTRADAPVQGLLSRKGRRPDANSGRTAALRIPSNHGQRYATRNDFSLGLDEPVPVTSVKAIRRYSLPRCVPLGEPAGRLGTSTPWSENGDVCCSMVGFARSQPGSWIDEADDDRALTVSSVLGGTSASQITVYHSVSTGLPV